MHKERGKMTTLIRFAWAVLPSIFVGVVMAFYAKKQSKKEKEVEDRAEARKKESLLQLRLQFAIGKLAYATAIAQRDGMTNGEMVDGINSYNNAVSEYNRFVNETHIEFLQEEKK